MGRCTDMTGLHFDANTGRPAVWAPRLSATKSVSQFRMKWVVSVNRFDYSTRSGRFVPPSDREVYGVGRRGRGISCSNSGGHDRTFLRGLMHVGDAQQKAGGQGEAAAIGLSAALQEVGLIGVTKPVHRHGCLSVRLISRD